jgi:hypothetical protein
MNLTRMVSFIAPAAMMAVGCGLIMGPDGSEDLSIGRFVANPERVNPGDRVTLIWSVEGAESVSINNGVGEVEPRGSKLVSPTMTTSYTLTATGLNGSATSTVNVVVGGASPSPSPSPGPTPSPAQSPPPSPSPSPSPSPTPSPTPSPSNPPVNAFCGSPATAPGACPLTIAWPNILPAGQCLQLSRITVSPSCPVANGTARNLSFDIKANVGAGYTWRKSAASGDAITPNTGVVNRSGVTTVNAAVVVNGDALTYEVVDANGRIVMTFTIPHR